MSDPSVVLDGVIPMKFRTDVCTVLSVAFSMCFASPLFAQGAGASDGSRLEAPRDRDSQLDAILKEMPDDAERSVRDALTKADVQIDQRGIDPFTEEWDLLISNTTNVLFDFDLEGNMILANSVNGTLTIEKYSVASNITPTLIWSTDLDLINIQTVVDIDLDGNIYVAGYDFNDVDNAYLVKLSPEGFVNWRRAYPRMTPALTRDQLVFSDMHIDPDGVPFLIQREGFAANESLAHAFLYRIDPVSGVVAFRVDLEERTGIQTSGRNGYVEMDPAGRLFSMFEKAGDPTTQVLSRVDGGTGEIIWSRELDVTLVPFSFNSDPLEASPLGGVVVVGSDTGQFGFFAKAIRVSGSGDIQWAFDDLQIDNGVPQFTRAHAFIDGSVIVSGHVWGTDSGNPLNGGYIYKLDPSGGVDWADLVFGSDFLTNNQRNAEGFTHLQVDRTGNVYVLMRRLENGINTLYSVVKFSADGTRLWESFEPVPNGFEDLLPTALSVDGGGNIFAVALRASPGINTLVTKYSQPFLGVPTIQTASATLSFEDQSIWAPGVGNLVAQEELFTVDWDEDFSIDATFTVPLLGEFGGDFMFFTSGTLDTGVRAEVDGGTADVHFPIDIQFGIPPVAKVSTGQQVTIAVDWDVDPAARLTSCFTPTFNAGLTAAVDYSVFSSLRLVAFSSNLLNTTFINDAEVIDEDYVPEANLLDILAGQGFLVPGEWASFEDPNGIVSADFRTPQMFAQGMYDPMTNSFSTTADDRFFRFGVSVTEAVLKPFGLTAMAEFEAGTTGGEFLVRGEGAALQLGARADIGASQDIDVGVTPMITYDFVGNENIPSQTLPLGVDLNFTVPSGFDGVIEIIPTITASADFFNSTDIEMFPGITWDTIEVGGAASAFGFDLIDFGPECLFCYDWDVSEILEALGAEPGLADFTVNVFDDGWQIPLQSVTLPCIRVLGTSILDNPPNIEGASRESLSMVIYDQTSPSVSSFNVATAGTSRMILYGERFASGSVGMIEHWGRTESLPTTFINPNTLLVEVPNRFRLLPGVAKLFVETSVKSKVVVSDTIDLAINFPVPRLDAVNPNLWAADPDLAVLPVSVIDAKSFAGNDTFITRRDYYIKMRDDLWSDITDGGFVGGADDYFTGFDFNKLPEFPSVLWSSKGETLPLPRFVQPVDNGIHNVRLAEDQYDVPMMVPVVICNPGPGGGMSNELMLTIAAPTPVTNSVMPSNFSPLDVIMDENYFDPMDVPVERPIELRITGPAHVPTFNGYEEPKFGNFNAASVVRFNGLDIPTTFISSSLLIAQLPADLATLGDHWISVSTPSNGTQYFEEQRVDANFDGVPDDIPAFQGLVDSGGESAPLLFRVRYREPVIAEVVPALIDQDSPAFDDSNFMKPRPFNLTLLGEDFREGAQVYFNGQFRSSQVIDSTQMKVKLLPEDVSMLGTFDIVVQNPFPQGDQSTPAVITVSDLNLTQKKGL